MKIYPDIDDITIWVRVERRVPTSAATDGPEWSSGEGAGRLLALEI
jgi:hypothetical protein